MGGYIEKANFVILMADRLSVFDIAERVGWDFHSVINLIHSYNMRRVGGKQKKEYK